jgi:hypothetical protein
VMAGWRYALACGVMLLWLTYPGGPPRSNFAYYYSYASLTVMFMVLPFALRNLERAIPWLTARMVGGRPKAQGGRRRAEGGEREREAEGARRAVVVLAMGAVLAANLWAHLPGRGPEPIRPDIDPAAAWGKGPGVNAPVVQRLIDQHLTGDRGSVLSQFYTFCSIPQRRFMYVTLWDREAFLSGALKPKFVLLDLNAEDPWVSGAELDAMAAVLRKGDTYRPIYDAGGVLLYQRQAGR